MSMSFYSCYVFVFVVMQKKNRNKENFVRGPHTWVCVCVSTIPFCLCSKEKLSFHFYSSELASSIWYWLGLHVNSSASALTVEFYIVFECFESIPIFKVKRITEVFSASPFIRSRAASATGLIYYLFTRVAHARTLFPFSSSVFVHFLLCAPLDTSHRHCRCLISKCNIRSIHWANVLRNSWEATSTFGCAISIRQQKKNQISHTYSIRFYCWWASHRPVSAIISLYLSRSLLHSPPLHLSLFLSLTLFPSFSLIPPPLDLSLHLSLSLSPPLYLPLSPFLFLVLFLSASFPYYWIGLFIKKNRNSVARKDEMVIKNNFNENNNHERTVPISSSCHINTSEKSSVFVIDGIARKAISFLLTTKAIRRPASCAAHSFYYYFYGAFLSWIDTNM